ncbi:hypothetical protein DRH27_04070, partial [Candidatus Falkowbacteria bacterium]
SLASDYIFIAYSDAGNSNAGIFSIYNSLGNLAVEPIIFSNSNTANIKIIELTNGNIVIAYTNSGNLNYGEFVIYGNNGVKALGPIEFNQGETDNISIVELVNENIFITYTNKANSDYGEFVIYNQSGGLVLDPAVFNAGATESISTAEMTNDNVFIAYANKVNSNYGEFIIYDTNLGELLAPVVFNLGETDNISVKELNNENVFIAFNNKENFSNGEFVIYNYLGEEVSGSKVFIEGDTGNIAITKTLSGYIFMAYSDINTIECIESDWEYSLEPAQCPSSGIQNKNWELISECAGGVSHPASEEISCDYTPELPVCDDSNWSYSLEPDQCPGSGIQTKNWELTGECAGGVSHPGSEEIKCVFSKVIKTEFLDKLKGRIILRVEASGEAYYINNSGAMFYLGRPADAFAVMRQQGIGIKNSDLEKIAVDSDEDYANTNTDYNFAVSHKGKIFLQVEASGEAWYIYPNDSKRYYLGRPADAFDVMRNLGLGIPEDNFNKL